MSHLSKLDKIVSQYETHALQAGEQIAKLMEERVTIDVLEYMLDVLYFRNYHLFETISFLLEHKHIVGAEFILRTQFEGTVILEWCLVDPKDRGQRLHKVVNDGVLELNESGFLSWDKERLDSVQEAQNHWEEANLKGLPNVRQMLESLNTYKQGYSYDLYKYLSKQIHGVPTHWHDFLDCSGENPRVCPAKFPDSFRILSCRAISAFLQMKNMTLIASLDKTLNCGNIESLEAEWEAIYPILYLYENTQHGAASDAAARRE